MQNIAKQYLDATSKYATRTNAGTLTKLSSTKQLNVYGAQGHGFVIISKDDDFSPVLGYSDTDFSEGNMPCGFQWWLNQVDASLEARKNSGKTYFPESYTTSSATNFVKSTWNQMAPYNNLCPKINGTAAPTGCVATAMAQIMYYFKYPTSGKGTATYYVHDTEGTKAYQVDINSTYAYDKMKDKYLRPVDTDDAVATLMRDAGAASKMQYSTQSSGTTDLYAAMGFSNNFRYDSLAIKRYARDFYSDEEWMQMISDEMNAQRPILYCGQDPIDGGHAFIFDGINEAGLVHVNWGWSGSGNGWYDINVLKPTSYGGSGLGDGEGFHESQSMVFGFKCQEVPDVTEENTSLWLTDGFEFFVEDNKLSLRIYDLINLNCRYFDGTIDLVLEKENDPSNIQTSNIINTASSEDRGPIAPGYGYFFTDDDDKPGEFELSEDFPSIAPGDYKLYIASKSTEESSYQIVRGEGGLLVYSLNVATDGTMSIDKAGNATGIGNIQSSNASQQSAIYDLNGKKLPSDECSRSGILIMKQGNLTKKILRR